MPYSVRPCRGHWHVTTEDGEMDLHDPSWASDKFATEAEAREAAGRLALDDELKPWLDAGYDLLRGLDA